MEMKELTEFEDYEIGLTSVRLISNIPIDNEEEEKQVSRSRFEIRVEYYKGYPNNEYHKKENRDYDISNFDTTAITVDGAVDDVRKEYSRFIDDGEDGDYYELNGDLCWFVGIDVRIKGNNPWRKVY